MLNCQQERFDSLCNGYKEVIKMLIGLVAATDYAAALEIPKRTAQNHLKRLTSLGLLRRTGSGPSTKYEIMWP